MSDDYYQGKGCECYAHSSDECGCDADWTDPEVYRLRDEVDRLKGVVLALLTYREGTKYYQKAEGIFREMYNERR